MNVHQLPVFAGIAVILLGILVLGANDPGLPHLDPPSIDKARAAKAIELEMPPIADFQHYYGKRGQEWRNSNPFIPFNARQRELAAEGRRDEKDDPNRRQPVTRGDKPLEVPKNEPPPPKPEAPQIPELDAQAVHTPVVVGFARLHTGSTIRVQFGEDAAQEMRPGDAHLGWTLVKVESGYAVFRNADGFEQRFPVGNPISGTTIISGGGGGSTGSSGLGDASAMLPQTPGSGGGPNAGGRPGGTGQNGGNNPDPQAIISAIEADPRGRRLLEQNPNLRQMLLTNPSAARIAAQRLGLSF